jgi:hypothetical protein
MMEFSLPRGFTRTLNRNATMFELLLELFSPGKQRGANPARQLATLVVIAFTVGIVPGDVSAQKWTGHRFASPNAPPGAIGRKQFLSSKHRRGYVQPVRIDAPKSTWLSPAVAGSFGGDSVGTLQVGLQIGEVYRFEVVSAAGDYTVYPSVELIDRLYPPHGESQRFPIPIELTDEELKLAAAGHYVTRVIYVEDPNNALPYRTAKDGAQEYFEVFPDQDPVEAAYGMGRPVAILRMGAKTPVRAEDTSSFTFGNPGVEVYPVTPKRVSMSSRGQVAPASYEEEFYAPKLVRPPSNPRPLK